MKKTYKVVGIIFIGLVILLLVGPFLVPVNPLGEISDPKSLAYPDSQFAEINGVDIHYRTSGREGIPILLLHGFASNTHSWSKVIQPLVDLGSTVTAFDRPAFGLSERPIEWTGDNPYTTGFAADLTVGLLDKLGINQAVLMGNSAGGTVSLLTALEHPERVKALILVDPAVYAGGPNSAILRALYKTPQVDHLGPLGARQIAARVDQLIRMAWHDPSKLTKEDLAEFTKPLQIKNWDRALWEFTKASQDLKLEEKLDLLTVPVLVITGDDDRIVPTADSIRLAGEIPNAQLVVLPNCGHVPQEECPAEFTQAVNDFLAKLP